MLIRTFLSALQNCQQATRLAADPQLDDVQRELARSHVAHTERELQEALDDYIRTRVTQCLAERELTSAIAD
jgi:cellobiose-specific phosphotransferase system component IIA